MRSIIFNIYFFTANPALFLLGLISLPFGPRGVALATRIWAWFMVYGAKYIAGINFEIRGEIPRTPVVYASRHESAWETMFIFLLPLNPACVFKKELIYIPLFGLYLLAGGHILVDRKSGASSLKRMLAACRKKISEGRSVVIFPEGTRTKPGEKGKIKSGIIAVYNNLDVPIIPVSLNSGSFWGKNSLHKESGEIIVKFGAPIERNLSRQKFLEALEKNIS